METTQDHSIPAEFAITLGEASTILGVRKNWVHALVTKHDLTVNETPLGRLYDRRQLELLAHARLLARAGRPRRGRPRKHPEGGGMTRLPLAYDAKGDLTA